MFDPQELEETVSLHEQGYELLRWVGKNLNTGALDFRVTHHAASSYEAAREWLARHLRSLPDSVRPPDHQLDRFARLFSSYLATSFTLVQKPPTRVRSYCGCYCSYCTYLGQADRLQVKTPSKGAKRVAEELKRVYLGSLAAAAGMETAAPAIADIVADRGLRRTLALATYAHELVRRTKFASQGEGVLVLWRQFAWNDNGSPIAGYRLRPENMLEAERELLARQQRR
jgi:hypothetical protein